MPTTSAFALRPASAAISPITVPAPAMSHFMSSMPPAGLMEMPPVSKVTPLPMKASGLAAFLPFGAPIHFITTMRGSCDAALRHAEQRAEAELLHLLRAEDLDLDAELGQRLAAFRAFDRRQHVGRFADQVAGQEDAVGDRLHRREGGLGLGGIGDGDGDALDLRLVLLLLLRPVAVETVGFQRHAEGKCCRQRRRQPIGGNHRLAFLRDGAGDRPAGRLGRRRPEGRPPCPGRSATTLVSPAPGAQSVALWPLRPLNFAASSARAMAPPVASSACLRQAGERRLLGQRQDQRAGARQGRLHEGDVGHGDSVDVAFDGRHITQRGAMRPGAGLAAGLAPAARRRHTPGHG